MSSAWDRIVVVAVLSLGRSEEVEQYRGIQRRDGVIRRPQDSAHICRLKPREMKKSRCWKSKKDYESRRYDARQNCQQGRGRSAPAHVTTHDRIPTYAPRQLQQWGRGRWETELRTCARTYKIYKAQDE
nr:hypothetical protein CFP56_13220 [Quercus suber]